MSSTSAPTTDVPTRAEQPGVGRPATPPDPQPERFGPTPGLSAGRSLESNDSELDAKIADRS